MHKGPPQCLANPAAGWRAPPQQWQWRRVDLLTLLHEAARCYLAAWKASESIFHFFCTNVCSFSDCAIYLMLFWFHCIMDLKVFLNQFNSEKTQWRETSHRNRVKETTRRWMKKCPFAPLPNLCGSSCTVKIELACSECAALSPRISQTPSALKSLGTLQMDGSNAHQFQNKWNTPYFCHRPTGCSGLQPTTQFTSQVPLKILKYIK